MTTKTALAEAVRRWGRTAMVRSEPKTTGGKLYTVGRIDLGMFFSVRGQGDSWEAAFAEDDKRMGRETARAKEIVAGNLQREVAKRLGCSPAQMTVLRGFAAGGQSGAWELFQQGKNLHTMLLNKAFDKVLAALEARGLLRTDAEGRQLTDAGRAAAQAATGSTTHG